VHALLVSHSSSVAGASTTASTPGRASTQASPWTPALPPGRSLQARQGRQRATCMVEGPCVTMRVTMPEAEQPAGGCTQAGGRERAEVAPHLSTSLAAAQSSSRASTEAVLTSHTMTPPSPSPEASDRWPRVRRSRGWQSGLLRASQVRRGRVGWGAAGRAGGRAMHGRPHRQLLPPVMLFLGRAARRDAAMRARAAQRNAGRALSGQGRGVVAAASPVSAPFDRGDRGCPVRAL